MVGGCALLLLISCIVWNNRNIYRSDQQMSGDNFIDNFKKILSKRNVTGAELARRLGVKQQTVSKWVSGKSIPSAIKLNEIAALLEVDMSCFFKAHLTENIIAPSLSSTRKDIPLLTTDEFIQNSLMGYRDNHTLGQERKIVVSNSVEHKSFALIVNNNDISSPFDDGSIVMVAPKQQSTTNNYFLLFKWNATNQIFIRKFITEANFQYFYSLDRNEKKIEADNNQITIYGCCQQLLKIFF